MGSRRGEPACRGPPSLMVLGAPPFSAGSRASGSAQVAQRDYTGPSPQGRMGRGAHRSPGGVKAALTALPFSTSCPHTLRVLKESSHRVPRICGWQGDHGPSRPAYPVKHRAQPGALSTFSLLLTGLHASFSMSTGQFAQDAPNQTRGIGDFFKASPPSHAQPDKMLSPPLTALDWWHQDAAPAQPVQPGTWESTHESLAT